MGMCHIQEEVGDTNRELNLKNCQLGSSHYDSCINYLSINDLGFCSFLRVLLYSSCKVKAEV